MRLKAFALEGSLSEPEVTAPPVLGNDTAETLFDKGLKCRTSLMCQFARLFKQAL